MKVLNRNVAVRVAALVLLGAVLVVGVLAWPMVKFLYRERTLAEAVRKYTETPGIYMTADDDIRQYLVKLAKHHRMTLGEGDVEIDYQTTADAFGVPVRIGYTLSAEVNFHGLQTVPLLAQRSFEIAKQQRMPQSK